MYIKSYFAFTSKKYRLLYNFLAPFICILIGSAMGLLFAPIGSAITGLFIFISDLLSDSSMFGKFCGSGNENLDYIKSSQIGIKYMKCTLIGDQVVRFLKLALSMIIVDGILFAIGREPVPGVTYMACLTVFMAATINTIISRNTDYLAFSMLGSSLILAICVCITLGLAILIHNQLITNIVLAIVAIGVAALIHVFMVSSLKKQFVDKE